MVQRTKSPKRRKRAHDKHVLAGELGRRMFFRGIALQGDLPELGWRKFLILAAHAMGMSPVASAASWRYPLHDGAGGEGFTFLQPITESFVALDTWPAHQGAYLFICSCVPFAPDCLKALIKQSGLKQGRSIGAPDVLEIG